MSSRSTSLGRGPRAGLVLMLVWQAIAGCDSTPAKSAADTFAVEVVPILEARCSAAICHGVTPAGRAAGEVVPETSFAFFLDSQGRIHDPQAARAQSLRFVNAAEGALFSTLVRKPLGTLYGGLAHGGGDNIQSAADPAMAALDRWIALEAVGGEDPVRVELTEREQFFAEAVLPVLMARGCATMACHGPSAFNPYVLDPGIPGPDGERRFGVDMVLANYELSRRFLALDGHPEQSRLLRKALPLARGGIAHRGGNRTFLTGPDDAAAVALLAWAVEEGRLAGAEVGTAAEETAEEAGRVTGIVYVRGPVRPGSVFDVTVFSPGTHLYLREPAGPGGIDRNLTGHLHEGQGEVRDPAVSADGRRVVFSMRPTAEAGFSLFEIVLASGASRQLTWAPARLPSGKVGADVMPVYAPDEAVYFVSNRHDRVAERMDATDLSIYRLLPGEREPTRVTFGPGPELYPRIFQVGLMQGNLVFAHRRSVGVRDETVGFFFPLDLHADYHIFFGITPAPDHFLLFEEMPDGRALTILGHPENKWGGGRLAIVDRILGPVLGPEHEDEHSGMNHEAGQESRNDVAVPGFATAFRVLDASASIHGVSPGGVYRDPAALPDGTILVARALGPLDHSDAEAEPRFEIYHLTLREAGANCTTPECMPHISRSEIWISARDADVSVYSPQPVVSRNFAPAPPVMLDPEAPTLFALADARVSQAVLENLFPQGQKRVRDDVHYIRLVEALPQPPANWRRAPRGPGTNLSLLDHLPARILAEVAVEADYSALLAVPPQTPFRLQLLDADRMAVGAQHNRWIFAWAGEYFPESIDLHRFDTSCGGCHGTFSGDPLDVLGPVDTVTAATATLAGFEDRNPRRPREPVALEAPVSVVFERDVQPVLDRRCTAAGCHGVVQPAGGLVLEGTPGSRFTASYESLLAPGEGSGGQKAYVDAPSTSARTSYLMEVVLGRELDAVRALIEHPPLGVTEDERLTLVRWIETGAAFREPREEEP